MRIILRLDPVADFFAQACGIEGEQVDRFDPFQRCLCGVQPSGILEQGGDISVLQPSVCIEKFQAVAVEREMECGRGDAGIVPHADPQIFRRLSGFGGKPACERLGNPVCGLAGQGDGLSLYPFHRNSPHVTAILQPAHFLSGNRHKKPS